MEENTKDIGTIVAEVMEDESVKLMVVEAKGKVDVLIDKIKPIAEEFDARLEIATEWVDALTIESQNDIDVSTEGIRVINASSKGVNEARLFFLGDHKKFTGEVDGLFNPNVNAFKELGKKAGKKCQAFLDEEERKRRVEQNRIDKIAADKQAYHDRQVKLKLEEAARLEAEGEDTSVVMEKAQTQMEKSHAVVPDVVPGAVEHAGGSHSTAPWKGEVTDKKAFVKALAAGIIPWDDEYINIPKKLLNDKARGFKNTVKYPGLRFFQDKTFVVK